MTSPSHARHARRGLITLWSARRLWASAQVVALSFLPCVAERGAVLNTDSVPANEHAARQPPRLSAEQLRLRQAVDLTLRHSPDVLLAAEQITIAEGRYRAARGSFDGVLLAGVGYTVDRHENFPFIAQAERRKRRALRSLVGQFTQLSEELAEALADNEFVAPECPVGFTLDEQLGIIEQQDLSARSGVSFENTALIINIDGITTQVADVFEICRPPETIGPSIENQVNLKQRINDSQGLGLDNVFEDLSQVQRGSMEVVQEIAELVSTRAALALARIGDEPKDEEASSTTVSAGYVKPTRSGVRLDVDLRLESSERRFRNKSLDPSFGGLGIPTRFPSSVSASLDIPLGKGRGRATVTAPEVASRLNVDAQLGLLRHTMNREAFSTILAYLDLVAAQSNLELLRESAERQSRVLRIVERLVEEGDVARSELARVRARSAAIQAALAGAGRTVVDARLSLANTIGLEVNGLDGAPRAGDEFPASIVADATRSRSPSEAVAQRHDLRAFEQIRDASRVLAEAARDDLSRRKDLYLAAGFSTFYESPFFRHLPDELEERPTDTAVRFYEPEGLWRSVSEEWNPFVMFGLTLDVPFRNNVAKGRLLQQESRLRESEIKTDDLERVIRDNVVSARGELARALEAVRRRDEAVRAQQEILESTLLLLEDGDVSVIDVLTTEEELTGEKLAFLGAQQRALSLLARLRFETGTLLSYSGDGRHSSLVRPNLEGLVR